jgi:GntR family transcriptional regulator, rspAB operon transcriptional repressor
MTLKKAISLRRTSLSDQVFEHVKRMILSEELHGGQYIPEESIASTFGVSRTPIREALRKLEKIGLVKMMRHNRSKVILLEPEDGQNLSEVRARIESLSASRLARKATEHDRAVLKLLTDECLRFMDGNDIAGAFEKDNQFHLEIAKRGGNTYLVEILDSLSAKVHLLRTISCVTPDRIRLDLRQHYPIINAIISHDEKRAEKLMAAHCLRDKASLKLRA